MKRRITKGWEVRQIAEWYGIDPTVWIAKQNQEGEWVDGLEKG